ncbi:MULTISPECIES: DUF4224 domain-containing protein [Pseudomonas]|jgi:hypothetical protein|uniref:DUF4224 domain-containing protein n=1 Tax=Pseudomonas TaxID=286 RepID=UPI0008BDB6AF|nr:MULTISPECIES: DUF4224 domain-containing protein [Pseudomonas]MDT3718486.1 DUF4224 domain-containing protein [Pseudomonas oryzihabitans]SEO64927.1 protein of unknown function [Pseudomonas sp. Snoq117.2]HJE68845.1 DUF4224 domain-containing protein [Pseudomonas oryzihabitans]
MFLTEEEVAELTGYKRARDQVRWLERERFGFVIDGNGRPKVLREVVLARLGSVSSKRKEPQLRLA